ncbi:unnamed protein product [Owenia fusiformis]|uniref:Uncharacterized protein n=1 Tax=Owenia fusiformis TaxID=6347 RepID=A0A8J1U8H9_OWEFU|nr:unnamed protein product [Owenia fusiformis]
MLKVLKLNIRMENIHCTSTIVRRIFPGILIVIFMMTFYKIFNDQQKITPKCNFDYLRGYFAKTGKYPSKGKWSENAWQPDGCILPKSDKSDQMKFIERNKLTSILVLGDSTAYRYHDAIQIQLDGIYGRRNCKAEKLEGLTDAKQFFPDREYFDEIPDVVTRERGCGGCHSITYSCNTSRAFPKITTEFLSMDYFMDTSVTTRRETRTKTCKPNLTQFESWGVGCGSSLTTQEFIFNEYLATKTSSQYPQLIILVANFHDIKRHNVDSFKRTLTWFMDIVNQSTKEYPDTKIIWFQPTYILKKNQPIEYHNMTSQARNSELYENVKEVLTKYFEDNSGRFLPFYSLEDISHGVPDLNVDGIHYKKDFYIRIIQLFFDTLISLQKCDYA